VQSPYENIGDLFRPARGAVLARNFICNNYTIHADYNISTTRIYSYQLREKKDARHRAIGMTGDFD
jgi:hypothetical protein